MEHRINPEAIIRLIVATFDIISEDSRLVVDDEPAGAWLHKALKSLEDAGAYMLEVLDIEADERDRLQGILADVFGQDQA